MNVILRKGDISECQADVLVNSTSSNLDLSSGPVTQSILQTGGDSLQTQCNEEFPDGIDQEDIAITDGGGLPCVKVYHVSLPEWSDDGEAEEALQGVIQRCLSEASEDFETIAFPAVGTGTLLYPPDLVARVMFDTIADYDFDDDTTLETVFIILNPVNEEVVQAFTSIADQYDSVNINITVHFDDDNFVDDGDEDDDDYSIADLFDFCIDEDSDSDSDSEVLDVKIIEGDITGQVADVIVNSTVPSLNLSSGPLSKAILQAGGETLQEECKSKYPKGIGESDIAITSGGDLQCEFVYHTTSCQWSTGQAEQKLRNLVENLLQEADSAGFSSIAIPALGTGVLKYPPEVVARCMFQTAQNFSAQSLKKIYLVVRSTDKAVLKAYKNELEKYAPGHNGSTGTFRVTVVKGDISEQNTDVIVNSTTPTLNLSSGPVTKEILKAGGDNLQAECKKKYPRGIKFGDIAETSCGNLACRALYHITLEKWSKDVQKVFCDLIVSCLQRASDSGMRSIGFPVLGTGTLKYPRDTVAQCIFESFDTFSANNPGTSLTEARIVVHPNDVENLKIFEDVNYAQANPGQSAIFSDMTEFFNPEQASEYASAIQLPSHWIPMGENDFVSTVKLSPGHKEYKMVEKNFKAGVGSNVKIEKIERIQNKTLHIQYKMHKHLIKSRSQGVEVERHLWHGTSYDAIQSINVYGFSRSYTGKNATVYGEGTYFAVSSSYSAQNTYSPPNDKGKRHMYMAAVLTGHYTEGDSGMRFLPARDDQTPHIKYDTAVDDVDNPTIFVVFHDVQAYPQYLVTFV